MIPNTAYFSSTLLMFILVPVIIFISRKFQLLDQPGQRKIHINYIPRLGGVAMFLSIGVSLWIAHKLQWIDFGSSFWPPIFGGSLCAFMLGLWDDLKNIPAKKKLVFQIFLGLLAFGLGFRIDEIQVGLGHPLHFGSFSPFITVFWIVMIMNAFNMIDGLDGLATGYAALVFSALSILGYLNGSDNVMVLSFVCAGACYGFLFFNYHPAKIFMGDCGSMMFGYILSILTLSSGLENVTVNILTPFFLLAFPLIDLFTTILRRIINAKTSEKGISYLGAIRRTFEADGNHIHHRLLKLGFSQRKITAMIYAFTIASCGLGLVSIYFSFGLIFFLFIFYGWFTVQIIRLLDYEEFVTGAHRNRKREFEEKRKLSTAPSLIKKVL
jgi:UDP-GlcNAc:undecaprenyl-phosphate GlcNAc-1-phosphate transferase